MNAITSPLPADAGACCPSCGQAISDHDDAALAIACTLGADDLQDRVAAIRALAARSLLRGERDGLTLRLTYASDALAEVESLVARESECCAFLGFDLTRDAEGVHVAITAPAGAAEAADALFAHFAPELAGGAA